MSVQKIRYSRALLLCILLGYVVLGLEALMGAPPAEFTLTLTVEFIALAAAAIFSAVYCSWVYLHRREEALFLLRNVARDVTVSIGAACGIGYLALAVSGHGLGIPWGPVVLSIPFAISFFWPTDDALLWRRERRDYAQAEAAKARLAELKAQAAAIAAAEDSAEQAG